MFDIFLIFAQNIDCGYTLEPPRRGGSNEYPQSMFWSKNKKNRYTPKGVFIARTCFPDVYQSCVILKVVIKMLICTSFCVNITCIL